MPRQIHQHRAEREGDAVPERGRVPAAPGPEPGRRSGQDPEHQEQVSHDRAAAQATPAGADASDEEADDDEGEGGATEETGAMRSAR